MQNDEGKAGERETEEGKKASDEKIPVSCSLRIPLHDALCVPSETFFS
jgi:hypothetical protein